MGLNQHVLTALSYRYNSCCLKTNDRQKQWRKKTSKLKIYFSVETSSGKGYLTVFVTKFACLCLLSRIFLLTSSFLSSCIRIGSRLWKTLSCCLINQADNLNPVHLLVSKSPLQQSKCFASLPQKIFISTLVLHPRQIAFFRV